jgi:hypothetical protein
VKEEEESKSVQATSKAISEIMVDGQEGAIQLNDDGITTPTPTPTPTPTTTTEEQDEQEKRAPSSPRQRHSKSIKSSSKHHRTAAASSKGGEEHVKTKRVECIRRLRRTRSRSQDDRTSQNKGGSRSRSLSSGLDLSTNTNTKQQRARSRSKSKRQQRSKRGGGDDDDKNHHHHPPIRQSRSKSQDTTKDEHHHHPHHRSSRSELRDSKTEHHRSSTKSRDTKKEEYRSKSKDGKKDHYHSSKRSGRSKLSSEADASSVTTPSLTSATSSSRSKNKSVPKSTYSSDDLTAAAAASPSTTRNLIVDEDPAILAMSPKRRSFKNKPTQKSGDESVERSTDDKMRDIKEAFKRNFPGIPLPSDGALKQRFKQQSMSTATFYSPQTAKKRMSFTHNPHISPKLPFSSRNSRRSMHVIVASDRWTQDETVRSTRSVPINDNNNTSSPSYSDRILAEKSELEKSSSATSNTTNTTLSHFLDTEGGAAKQQPPPPAPADPWMDGAIDLNDSFSNTLDPDTTVATGTGTGDEDASKHSSDMPPTRPKRSASKGDDVFLMGDEKEQENANANELKTTTSTNPPSSSSEEKLPPNEEKATRQSLGLKKIASKVVEKSKSVFKDGGGGEQKKAAKKEKKEKEKQEKEKEKNEKEKEKKDRKKEKEKSTSKTTTKEEGDACEDAHDSFISPKNGKLKSVFVAAKSRVSILLNLTDKEKEAWGELDDGSCSVNLIDSEDEDEDDEEGEDNNNIQQRNDTVNDSISSPKSSSNRFSKSSMHSSTHSLTPKSHPGMRRTLGSKSPGKGKVKFKNKSVELLQLDLDGGTSTHTKTADFSWTESSPESKRSSRTRRSSKTSSDGMDGRTLTHTKTGDSALKEPSPVIKRSSISVRRMRTSDEKARSCSPHVLRSATRRDRNRERQTEHSRAGSPSALRGDIARKRQSMVDIRKSRSTRVVLDEDGTSSEDLRSRRSETTSTSTPRPQLSDFDPTNESLQDLLKKVKERAENKKHRKSLKPQSSFEDSGPPASYPSDAGNASLPVILGLDGSVEW